MKKTFLTIVLTLGSTGAAEAQVTPDLGQIMIFGGNFCPTGWLATSGQLLSISNYTALFSILGTTYGGDGKTAFALPKSQQIYTRTRATYTECIAISGVFPSRN